MKTHAQSYPTLSDALLPSTGLAHDAAAVVVASLFIALCAQLEIVLPFTPVPLTGQTLGVLYAGALLGSRRGAAAVALYLLEGASGMPVFAGGAAGAAKFLGPTGGYLLGFPLGAFVTGMLAERGWDRTPLRSFFMILLGSAPIFACGLVGLSRFVPADALLVTGLLPFIPGDLIKAGISAGLLPYGWNLLGRKAAK